MFLIASNEGNSSNQSNKKFFFNDKIKELYDYNSPIFPNNKKNIQGNTKEIDIQSYNFQNLDFKGLYTNINKSCSFKVYYIDKTFIVKNLSTKKNTKKSYNLEDLYNNK